MKIKVKSAPHKNENVEINTEFIQLQAFLKFMGIAMTGGEAKEMVKDGIIRVNKEICLSRGKKLRDGDVITAFGTDYTIISNVNNEN